MGRIQARLFTLLQLVAAVVMTATLALPATGHAAERKASKVSRKAVASVERKKQKSARTDTAKVREAARRVAKSESGPRRTGSKRVVARIGGKDSSRPVVGRKVDKSTRLASNRPEGRAVRLVAHRPSFDRDQAALSSGTSIGDRLGLRSVDDALDLNSSVALVVDQQTNEVLFSKNDSAVLPIASLTKLMTGLVVTDANLPLDELVTITTDDIDVVKGSRSRLAVGTTLTRREMMHLALMSSENRAAHALGRTYPGGLDQFVRLMNAKARELGMHDTRYVEPTGLSSLNQSSARDLATLVSVAYQRPILRSLTTSPSHQLDLGNKTLQFRNSNGLIRDPDWDIGLQKTGYISEAGRCLVMQARVAGRQLIMVFLDATGKLGRAQDAERVRRWVEAQPHHPIAAALRPQG